MPQYVEQGTAADALAEARKQTRLFWATLAVAIASFSVAVAALVIALLR